jgi:hypothetical protein
MSKIFSLYFITLILALVSCTETKKETITLEVHSFEQKIEMDSGSNPDDSVLIHTNQPISDDLTALRELVLNEYTKLKHFSRNSVNSRIISDADSIRKFTYIVNMFPVEKIDSIEFYGIVNKQKVSPLRLRMNSLLILYFNDSKEAQLELDSLEFNYRKKFRATEGMFKPGGISFEIDNQLVVYSVNTCGPGYKNLQRIDTLVKKNVFKDKSFIRLHAGCGMGPFKRIEE